MKKNIHILLTIVFILIVCSVKGKQANNSTKTKVTKTLLLNFGFKVSLGQEEDFKTFKTYSFFELRKNEKTIYKDTSLEYEFGDKLYPIVLQTGKNKFELLFEINDRPNKNYLKRLIIKDYRVIKTDSLPTFISKATDLDNDGIKEYAGFWDYNEIWGESETKTDYNPILYYKIKPTGLKLDSLLTKENNTKIYGEFHGFEFNEKIEMPTTVLDKFEKEIKRITDKK
ncbi:hypothetical protein [uncultured Bacteroides sp.]|uniref:hypothetical protein n=1 Tax=uncultured Bacteroides sp. TaxID=162156 RepID=UPI002AAAA2E7|nr:hypothetical protein [uncultured Bacteroides sp.]